jgi:uncharacterized protein (DUF58 family)
MRTLLTRTVVLPKLAALMPPVWNALRSLPSRTGVLAARTVWSFSAGSAAVSIRLRQGLLPLGVLLATGWYLADPTRLASMAMAALAGLLLVSYWWVRQQAKSVNGSRRLRYAAVQVGDELEERITIHNPYWLPLLWVEFRDRSSIPGYTITGIRAVDAGGTTDWRANTLCERRGVYRLGPWSMTFSDPFGFFNATQVYPQHVDLLVYPQLARLPASLMPHNSVMGDHRLLRQPIAAQTISAISVRPYTPGDPLRRIHWRTTARRNSPFVRIFEPESSSTIWLIPDLDASVHPHGDCSPGGGSDSSLETLITLMASMANRLLRDNLSVGLFTHGEELTIIPPQHGVAHLWALLRALAPLEKTKDRPLAATLAHARRVIAPRELVLVATPSLSTTWLDELSRLSQSQHNRSSRVIPTGTVVLLDPQSFGGSGRAEPLVGVLAGMGVAAQVLHRGELEPIRGSYGTLRRWEFTVHGRGRALARQTPRLAGDPDPHRRWRDTGESS